MTTLTFTIASLRQRRLRTIVTVLSVTVALATLIVTMSASRRIGAILEDAGKPSRLTVTSLGGPMPFAYLAKLKQIPGVDAELEWSRDEGGGDGTHNFPIIIATNGFAAHIPHALFGPTPDQMSRWQADRQGLLATGNLMEQMHWKDGDLVTFKIATGELQARVIGKAPGSMEGRAIMHYDYVNTVKPGGVGIIDVACPPERYSTLSRAIEAAFETSDPPVMATSAGALSAFFMQSVSALPQLMEKIGILMGLISLVVTGSTLSMSIRERQSEFGILRALGFRRGRVFSLIVLQSVVTCLMGGLLGCVVPFILYREHGLTLGGRALENVTISPEMCAFGIGLSVLLGILIAILPATRTVRVDVVQALEDR